MKKQLADLLLYKWRYVLGYGALAALFILAVTVAGLYTPGGLTQAEINTLAETNALGANELALANLPFHVLQYSALSLFGASVITIKLPAILICVLSATVIFFLLRRWFKPGVAILSMLIMTATGQFIYIAQSATTDVLYLFYTALILLFSSLILQKAKAQLVWKIGLALSIGLSLYTPYFMYINLGLLIVALMHPHTRHHLLRRSQRTHWLIAALALFAITAPLIYATIKTPAIMSTLLGYPFASVDVLANLKLLLKTYFWVSPTVSQGQILPIMDFAALALIVLGLLILFRLHYTARTYAILAWLILALPLLILNPHLVTVIIIPLFILLAIGVETLLNEWYKLFPKNPYARGTGLVLIVGLISVMILSGADRFINGYRHTPDAVRAFSTDLTLMRKQLQKHPVRTKVVVNEHEKPLYDALARHTRKDLVITTDITTDSDITNVLVSRASHQRVPASWKLRSIITNDRTSESDRFYLYKAGGDTV